MKLKIKMVLLGIIPVIMALSIVTVFVQQQANELIAREVTTLEIQIINEKKQELINYTDLVLTSIEPLLNTVNGDQKQSEDIKKSVKLIVNNLTFSTDGYFFIYDMRGTNIVHPKQSWRIGENWWDLQDENGVYIIRDLISAAKQGGGFVNYSWDRPSTGTLSHKISYAVSIDAFDWIIGTGVYLDAIDAQVADLRADVAARVQRIFWLITGLMTAVVIGIGAVTSTIAYRETSFANDKLRDLYNDIVHAQEDERKRVSRELHDGISQILVSAKFSLARVKSRLIKNNAIDVEDMDEGFERIDDAIQEVRRISVGLRPKELDDLGLAAALQSLTERFSNCNGIEADIDVVPVHTCLNNEQKSALYRVTQEALTNIKRHAEATCVSVHLSIGKKYVVLKIVDNGSGLQQNKQKASNTHEGIGLKNMEERVASFGGALTVSSNSYAHQGTIILVQMPFSKTIRNTNLGADHEIV